MDSKQRFLQIYHEFIKDDNMLPSELYIVSFRYITIYHPIYMDICTSHISFAVP